MTQRICIVEGCNGKHKGLGYCIRHYCEFKNHGSIRSNAARTVFTPNEVVRYDDYAEIVLYNQLCFEVARVKIDLDDIDLLSKYKWRMVSKRYAMTDVNKKKVFMHHKLIDVPEGMVVDHINGNGLDNRRSNLRCCTQADNTKNQKLRSTNKTGYTGVQWVESRGRWYVYIMVSYKNIFLGSYDNINDAIEARKIAEEKYFGEFARRS